MATKRTRNSKNKKISSKKVKSSKGRKIVDLLMVLVLVLGFATVSYPFVSDSFNRYFDQRLIAHYQKKANADNQKAFLANKEKMAKENAKLAKSGGSPGGDPFADEKTQKPIKHQKDYYESHTIGIIHIPKINQSLPIFDGSKAIFLEKGAGLLEGTSYPTGGESTHATLTAHRGLPEAKLFTDLPKLKNGDEFYIEINGEMLAYEVFTQEVVEPTETDSLLIKEGKDLVTLLTCTPYMVNSHRLLVTGKRIPYVPAKATKQIAKVNFWNKYSLYLWITLGVVIVVILGKLVSKNILKKK